MADYTKEITKRRTFAIISHPDAGKTTLTEKFLLHFHSSKIILSAIFFLRQKRRIATTLLSCSEDGARERPVMRFLTGWK